MLEAFYQQLDNHDAVEVVAADIDFTDHQDFNFLFHDNPNLIEDIYIDAIDRVYNPDNNYLLSVFNASFGGLAPPPDAIDNFINEQNAFVVQAAANVNQVGSSWSESIENVINVGAWNIDQNGYILASSIDSVGYNDIYANGYISSGFGEAGFRKWNFGTSFATPRVSAELINFFDEKLTPQIEMGLLGDVSNEPLTQGQITDYTEQTIDALSTQMESAMLRGDEYYGPVNVLTSNLIYSSYPSTVSMSNDSFGLVLNDVKYYAPGLADLNLDDPLNFNEFQGSENSDVIDGFSYAAFFGLDGNDTFNSENNASHQIFIGGKGDDTYKINVNGVMTFLMAEREILTKFKLQELA